MSTRRGGVVAVRASLSRSPHPCWRTILFHVDDTVDDAADVLIAAFGWTNSHLKRFEFGNGWELGCSYTVNEEVSDFQVRCGSGDRPRGAAVARLIAADIQAPDRRDLVLSSRTLRWVDGTPTVMDHAAADTIEENDEYEDSDRDAVVGMNEVLLTHLLPRTKSQAFFNYDYGDDWYIKMTRVPVNAFMRENAAAHTGAVIFDGAGGSPPDDAGGIGAYAEFLEQLRDGPHDTEFKERRAWYRTYAALPWEPDGWDRSKVQQYVDRRYERAQQAYESWY